MDEVIAHATKLLLKRPLLPDAALWVYKLVLIYHLFLGS